MKGLYAVDSALILVRTALHLSLPPRARKALRRAEERLWLARAHLRDVHLLAGTRLVPADRLKR